MNTIDTSLRPDAPLPRRPIPDVKAERFETTAAQQSEQTASQQIVTERSVSEVSLRMDLIGLEYRRVNTTERQYNVASGAKKAEQQAKPSLTKDAIIEAEISETDRDTSEAGRQIQRAYLPHNPQNKIIRYLA